MQVNYTIISDRVAEYEPDWDGTIWRAGNDGVFYHVTKEGAEFYGEPEQYKLPQFRNVLHLDIDQNGLDIIAKVHKLSVDDIIDNWVEYMEEAIPIFKSQGYDAVLIEGETGMEVTGPPLEIVDLTGIKRVPIINSIADNIE